MCCDHAGTGAADLGMVMDESLPLLGKGRGRQANQSWPICNPKPNPNLNTKPRFKAQLLRERDLEDAEGNRDIASTVMESSSATEIDQPSRIRTRTVLKVSHP